MWSQSEIESYLKKNLKESRYEHTLGVKDTAVKLAKQYNGDVEKAVIAALLHDCAKNMEETELVNEIENSGYAIDEVTRKNPALLHSLAGAILAKEKMGVKDEEILNAIQYHTTGRKEMTLLEKIIYISDYVEPLRNFPGVETVREWVLKDLEEALLLCFNNSIAFVVAKGELLHPDTVEGRNALLMKRK